MLRSRFCAVAVIMLGFFPIQQAWAYDYTPLTIANCKDFVFDSAGILYASSGSQVVRYNTNTKAYLSPWTLGGTLLGIDLSPDGTTLAVADSTTQGASNRIFLVNTSTGTPTPVSFTRNSGEAGTFMVAWCADNCVLTTSSYSGSGWVPLRRYDPATTGTSTLRSVRQDTMLTASADRKFVGYAEHNSSGGPIGLYDVTAGNVPAATNVNHFVYEAAISPNGSQMVIPTYYGAHIYDRSGSTLTPKANVLGVYADHGPVGAVYSPSAPRLYTCEWDWNAALAGVKVYDTNTWQQIATLDNYDFPSSGNWALGQGRIEISPDGSFLAASVAGGLRLYNTPEPTTLGLLLIAALGAWTTRRRPA